MKHIIALAIIFGTSAAQATTCGGQQPKGIQALAANANAINSKASQDFRHPVDRTSEEFRQLNAIGVISEPGKSTQKFVGTGFLVSPCLVLTNHHVAFEKVSQARLGARLNFAAGQTGSKSHPFSESSGGRVVAFGANFKPVNSKIQQDWTLVKLDKPIGNTVGYIPLFQMSMEKLKNRPVITAGFPADKTENGENLSNVYADTECKIIRMSVYAHVGHTCQTNPGQSGSPMLAKNPRDGRYYAIGMVSAADLKGDSLARSENPDLVNVGVNFMSGAEVEMTTDGDKIVKAISDNKCD